MKIYVGIDIAKLNHFAAAISSDGEIIIEPFKFTNDADGFQLLVSKLESFDKNSLIIGLESTAHYGDNLVRYLVTELYQVCVLNPIKTCQMRKNNVRKTKTDKVDTYVIAKTLMIQDNLRFVSFFDLDMMDLKALGRFRQKTIKQRTRLKIQLTTYVDQVFPEIQYFSIRSASTRCLCFIKRSTFSKRDCFHAYDSSGKSAQSELTRTLYQRTGQRIKSSRTEVCRC